MKLEFSATLFWLVLTETFVVIAAYALYRMTQRVSTPVEETEAYLKIIRKASPVAIEAATTWSIDQVEEK